MNWQPPEDNAPCEPKMLRVDLRGKDPAKYDAIRDTLFARLKELLEMPLSGQKGDAVRREGEELSKRTLDYAKAKLEQPRADVEKTYAEVAKLYSERNRNDAEANKLNAEAEAMRLDTHIRQLKLTIGATKAFLVGDTGEEALLLGEQCEAFLDVLAELSEEQKLLGSG